MRSSGEDIAPRKASAQRFYGIPIENEEGFVTRLRAVESSNAETFGDALAREKSLHASYDRIARDPDLWRPITAARDVLKRRHRRAASDRPKVFGSFAPQLDLSFAAAIHGLAGLFLGSLIGELATAGFLSRQTRTAI